MDPLNELATEVGKALKQRGWLLATAESITGGSISQAITDIPGSSEWFDCGFVTYSNGSKTQFLDVTFVVRYILNEKYRIYKDDDITICDICKYQPHILMSDLEKEINNYDSDDDIQKANISILKSCSVF